MLSNLIRSISPGTSESPVSFSETIKPQNKTTSPSWLTRGYNTFFEPIVDISYKNLEAHQFGILTPINNKYQIDIGYEKFCSPVNGPFYFVTTKDNTTWVAQMSIGHKIFHDALLNANDSKIRCSGTIYFKEDGSNEILSWNDLIDGTEHRWTPELPKATRLPHGCFNIRTPDSFINTQKTTSSRSRTTSPSWFNINHNKTACSEPTVDISCENLEAHQYGILVQTNIKYQIDIGYRQLCDPTNGPFYFMSTRKNIIWVVQTSIGKESFHALLEDKGCQVRCSGTLYFKDDGSSELLSWNDLIDDKEYRWTPELPKEVRLPHNCFNIRVSPTSVESSVNSQETINSRSKSTSPSWFNRKYNKTACYEPVVDISDANLEAHLYGLLVPINDTYQIDIGNKRLRSPVNGPFYFMTTSSRKNTIWVVQTSIGKESFHALLEKRGYKVRYAGTINFKDDGSNEIKSWNDVIDDNEYTFAPGFPERSRLPLTLNPEYIASQPSI